MPEGHRSRSATVTSWIAQVAAAAILGQTLFFELTGSPESVAIFEALGAEPWGRLGTGTLEAVAVVLLLVPRTAALGGVLGLFLMMGAIGSHLVELGIEVQGDGGTLFVMAVVTLAASATVVVLRRRSLPFVRGRGLSVG